MSVRNWPAETSHAFHYPVQYKTKTNFKLVQGTFIMILTGYISSSKFLILYFLLFAAW